MIVITVHGVRTAKHPANWQEHLAKEISKRDTSVKVCHFKYGWVFGVVSWFMRLNTLLLKVAKFKARYVRELVHFIDAVRQAAPQEEIVIVAHSFGTFLVYEALQSILLKDPGFKIRGLVLNGAILSCHIENLTFDEQMEEGQIRRIDNFCSHSDQVVKKVAQWPYGKLGYYGFVRKELEQIDKVEPARRPYLLEIYNHHIENVGHCVYDKPRHTEEVLSAIFA